MPTVPKPMLMPKSASPNLVITPPPSDGCRPKSWNGPYL